MRRRKRKEQQWKQVQQNEPFGKRGGSENATLAVVASPKIIAQVVMPVPEVVSETSSDSHERNAESFIGSGVAPGVEESLEVALSFEFNESKKYPCSPLLLGDDTGITENVVMTPLYDRSRALERPINQSRQYSIVPPNGLSISPTVSFLKPKITASEPLETTVLPENPYGVVGRKFFEKIINTFNIEHSTVEQKIAVVLVWHVTDVLPVFLEALKKIWEIAIVIPKGMHRKVARENLDRFKQDYPDITFMDPLDCENNSLAAFDDDYNVLREKINAEGLRFLGKYVGMRPYIIIDDGAYFARVLETALITNNHGDDIEIGLLDRLVGIVENTGNGEIRYKRVVSKVLAKVSPSAEQLVKSILSRFSTIANSQVKSHENFHIGRCIVRASNTILSAFGQELKRECYGDQVAGIVGFGKVGKGIVAALQELQVPVCVYDDNPEAYADAATYGITVVDLKTLLNRAKIIFCATGQQCLKAEHVLEMQNGVYIACCTSRTSEFDATLLASIRSASNITKGGITAYDIHGKSVRLLGKGNAINFEFGSKIGPSVYEAKAGLLTAALNMVRHHNSTTLPVSIGLNIIRSGLTREQEQIIEKICCQHFYKLGNSVATDSNAYFLKHRARKNDVVAEDKKFHCAVCRELEKIFTSKHKVTFNSERIIIRDIITNIALFLKKESFHNDEINQITHQLSILISMNLFVRVVGYVSHLLLMSTNGMVGAGAELLQIKLLFLRTSADLFASSSNDADRYDTQMNSVIEGSFLELRNKISSYMTSLENQAAITAEDTYFILWCKRIIYQVGLFPSDERFNVGSEIIEEILVLSKRCLLSEKAMLVEQDEMARSCVQNAAMQKPKL